jgi:hypothetical protein
MEGGYKYVLYSTGIVDNCDKVTTFLNQDLSRTLQGTQQW